MKSLPAVNHFRWTFNNSFETNEIPPGKLSYPKVANTRQQTNRTGTFPYSYSSLKYHAKTEKDFGEVRCFASNSLGESESPCIFTLIPAGKFYIIT